MISLCKVLEEIVKLHRRHADDMCWMPKDLEPLWEAAELPKPDLKVGDRFAMLKNCVRYVECLEDGGCWRTYEELEADNKEMRLTIDKLLSKDGVSAGDLWSIRQRYPQL
jgi:hypothetical protein